VVAREAGHIVIVHRKVPLLFCEEVYSLANKPLEMLISHAADIVVLQSTGGKVTTIEEAERFVNTLATKGINAQLETVDLPHSSIHGLDDFFIIRTCTILGFFAQRPEKVE
jgi:hypothetical protein